MRPFLPLPALPLHNCGCTVGLSVAAQKACFSLVHNSCTTALQIVCGPLFCHCSLAPILNGSTAVPSHILRLTLILFGQYLCCSLKVSMIITSQTSIADQILAGRSPVATVRQHNNEDPSVTLMHISLITGTPVHPKLAFSVDLLDFFYHLCHRQPSIGIQGFIKAMCTFQQVCFSLSIHLQLTNYFHATRSSIAILWSNFFHKHSTSSPMCSADYKRGLMLSLGVMVLTGG